MPTAIPEQPLPAGAWPAPMRASYFIAAHRPGMS